MISQPFVKPPAVGLCIGDDVMALGTKKREARKSLRQSGWITLDGGFAARPCMVEDISPSGAKITVEDNNTLPARLRLAFSRDARTGRACEVVWRRGKTCGVKFVS
jgi:PilZ domain-containing protein